MPTIRPLGNRLVVRRWPEADVTESGLWLPSDAREKPQLGDVLAVGPGQRPKKGWLWNGREFFPAFMPPDISTGEVVVFEKMVSRDFEYQVGNERLLVLPYSVIYCAITELTHV